LSERFSVSVPPVANDICRSAVPAPNYLLERRSTAFPHHYTPACSPPSVDRKLSCCVVWFIAGLDIESTFTPRYIGQAKTQPLPQPAAAVRRLSVLFCSLAVLDPRVGRIMDVLSPFLSLSSVILIDSSTGCPVHTIRYDMSCYINVRSKADMSQLNLLHGA